MPNPESPRRKRRERSHHHHRRDHDRDQDYDRDRRASHTRSPRKSRAHATSSDSSTPALSAGALAKLNYQNQHAPRYSEITPKKTRQKRERVISEERYIAERSRKQHKRKKRRVVSGALLEEADGEKLRGLRGGTYRYEKDEDESFLKKRKRLCLSSSQIFPFCSRLTFLVSDMPWHFNLTFGYYYTSCSCALEKEQFEIFDPRIIIKFRSDWSIRIRHTYRC